MESDIFPEPSGEKETARLEAFSDGVFAIALTLLVLDIHIPTMAEIGAEGSLLRAVIAQWPMFLGYFISFSTVLVMWVNHHNLFRYIRRSTQLFLFLNGLLLLFVAFVPFPTALLAEYIGHREAPVAAAIYAGTFVALAVAFNLLWWYASNGKRLLDRRVTESQVRTISKQYSFGPPLYSLAFIFSFFNVAASVGICLFLGVFFMFTAAFERS